MSRIYRRPQFRTQPQTGRKNFIKIRIIMALVMAAFAGISYLGSAKYNPITGEKQYIAMTPEQEIALGLQAAPQMAAQHGGLHPDSKAQKLIDRIGHALVQSSAAKSTGWNFDFHLLADPKTVNAFALPGGQVFITAALFSRLKTEGQLAGVLGHEIGHVVARHSAQRMAKQNLTQGLIGSVLVGAGGQQAGQVAQMIGNMINMKYGREDELESDYYGVQFMSEAGYNPEGMIGVMNILADAAGNRGENDFFSTHPNPDNRIDKIKSAIKEHFPQGVPKTLKN